MGSDSGQLKRRFSWRTQVGEGTHTRVEPELQVRTGFGAFEREEVVERTVGENGEVR